jgi:hypothetical protein
MLNKELIAKLQKGDPDAEVWALENEYDGTYDAPQPTLYIVYDEDGSILKVERNIAPTQAPWHDDQYSQVEVL